jgi:hypothetical protein
MSSSSGGVPPSAREVVLGTVVPVIGGVVALIMYASPLKAVHTARKQKALGVSRVRALQRADMATQHAQPPQRPPPVLPAPPRRTSTRCPLLLRLPAQLAGTATGLQRQTTTCSFPTCLASLPRFSRRCHATRWQAQRCERKQPRRCMQDTTHGRTRMRTQHQQHTVRCWLRACVCVCVCVCVCAGAGPAAGHPVQHLHHRAAARRVDALCAGSGAGQADVGCVCSQAAVAGDG